MGRTSWIVLGASVVLGGGAAFWAPYRMITPGTLGTGHAALERDCLACHAPLRGTPRERCVACHRIEQLGLRSASGSMPAAANPKANRLHRLLGPVDCTGCHAGHRGWGREAAQARFAHDLLPAPARAACHECHATDRPEDDLHRSAGAGCGACHGTERWRPASYDHDRYFRFDRDHPSRCSDCHPSTAAATGVAGIDYRSYSCTGCHEHVWQRIVDEHREQRLREPELAACARCHRSAEESEVEHRGESRRGEDGDDD